jgi:hypothetical protein
VRCGGTDARNERDMTARKDSNRLDSREWLDFSEMPDALETNQGSPFGRLIHRLFRRLLAVGVFWLCVILGFVVGAWLVWPSSNSSPLPDGIEECGLWTIVPTFMGFVGSVVGGIIGLAIISRMND